MTSLTFEQNLALLCFALSAIGLIVVLVKGNKTTPNQGR